MANRPSQNEFRKRVPIRLHLISVFAKLRRDESARQIAPAEFGMRLWSARPIRPVPDTNNACRLGLRWQAERDTAFARSRTPSQSGVTAAALQDASRVSTAFPPNRPSQNGFRKRVRCPCGIRNAVVASSLWLGPCGRPPSAHSADTTRPVCGCAPSAFGVAAFGRKPPFEFPLQFAALCRDAATPGFRCALSARFPCGIQICPPGSPLGCNARFPASPAACPQIELFGISE
jgi:hypothetical protein